MICVSMPRRLRPILPLLALAIAGTGCGEQATRVDNGTLEVTLEEYRLQPQDVSVPAGKLRIVARNRGRLTHNLRVEIPREDPATPERAIGGTPTAQPGRTVSDEITLAPGTYRLACTIANHDDLGMWGELEVTDR